MDSDAELQRLVDRRIAALRASVEEAVREATEPPPELVDRGRRHISRYFQTRDLDDLRAGVRCMSLAVVSAEREDPYLPVVLRHYLAALNARRQRSGEDRDEAAVDADIARMVDAGEYAAGIARPGSEERVAILGLLGSALRQRALSTGDPADLDRALAALREALRSLHPRDPDRPDYISAYANVFLARHRLGRDLADLDQAIELYEGIAGGHWRLAEQLGDALRRRYRQNRDLADLEKAAKAYRWAAPRAPARSELHTSLGAAAHDLYLRRGAGADLELAASAFERALGEAPPGDPGLPRYVRNTGLVALDLYEFNRDPDRLDEALERLDRAVDLLPAGHPSTASFLDCSGHGWFLRALLTRDGGDIDRAIQRRTAALAHVEDERQRVETTRGLARAVLLRAEVTGERADFDEALRLADAAVRTAPRESSDRGILLSTRGRAAAARYGCTGESADRDLAVESYREACRHAVADRPASAVEAAGEWCRWAAARGAWTEMVEAALVGIEALESMLPVQLEPRWRFARLAELGPFVGHLGYALARLGRYGEALERVTRHRARFLTETLDRTQIDLSALGRRRGDLARRFRAAAARVAATDRIGVAPGSAASAPDEGEVAAANRDLAAVLDEIRREPGFDGFLLPPEAPPPAESRSVYLAASHAGGLALAGTPVWLPDLREDALRERSREYLRRYDERAERPEAWRRVLDETTAWLWDVLMGPLLAAHPPGTRLDLVPSRLLTLLPMHAAWRPDPAAPTGRRYALDEVTIAYRLRPTGPAAEPDPGRLLAASAPGADVTGRDRLAHADAEADHVLAAYGGGQRLLAGEATPEKILRGLTRRGVVHLACHGLNRPDDPLASGVLLAGEQWLTVRDVLAHRRLAARLAVLSACESAAYGPAVPDEALSLSAILHLAGVAGVIGSLWSVPDAGTTMLMAHFYHLWRTERLPPAAALGRAQQWLRDTTNAEKIAAYPAILEPVRERVPRSVRDLWEQARAYAHPYHWAAFGYLGD